MVNSSTTRLCTLEHSPLPGPESETSCAVPRPVPSRGGPPAPCALGVRSRGSRPPGVPAIRSHRVAPPAGAAPRARAPADSPRVVEMFLVRFFTLPVRSIMKNRAESTILESTIFYSPSLSALTASFPFRVSLSVEDPCEHESVYNCHPRCR